MASATAAAMAADHGDHVTPDQFKGRARRARNPPDVAVRRRHALVQTGVILAAVIGADTEPRCRRTGWAGAPIPNHEAPHRMGGHGNAQRAHERDDTGGQGRHCRPKDGRQRSGADAGAQPPRPPVPATPQTPTVDRDAHRRTSSSTPTRLAQVAGAGSTDRSDTTERRAGSGPGWAGPTPRHSRRPPHRPVLRGRPHRRRRRRRGAGRGRAGALIGDPAGRRRGRPRSALCGRPLRRRRRRSGTGRGRTGRRIGRTASRRRRRHRPALRDRPRRPLRRRRRRHRGSGRRRTGHRIGRHRGRPLRRRRHVHRRQCRHRQYLALRGLPSALIDLPRKPIEVRRSDRALFGCGQSKKLSN